MTIRRHTRTPIINGGKQYGTSQASVAIKKAVDAGLIDVTVRILQESERLDILAGQYYGDSKEWWIIAAASGIGWSPQVPPGTRIVIPTNRAQIAELVG